MTVVELLEALRRLDVHVKLDGERLRLDAPAGALSEDFRRHLRERKTEIVEFLRTTRQLVGQQRAIVPLKPTGTRPPIFAVPGAHGDLFMYWNLVPYLDAEQPFYGLQFPGLEDGTEPQTSVEGLARYFAEQVNEFHPGDDPLTIAGYCAGGTIAFELARQLLGQGRRVKQLILFGAPYCAVYRLVPIFNLVASVSRHARRFAGLPVTRWRAYLSGRIRSRRAASRSVQQDPVLLRREALARATMAAIRHYHPCSFNGHASIILPSESSRHSLDALLWWRRHVASSTEFVGSVPVVPVEPDGYGPHSMLTPDNAAIFADLINSACTSACDRHDGRVCVHASRAVKS